MPRTTCVSAAAIGLPPVSPEAELLQFIMTASPSELRQLCDQAEASPDRTPQCLMLAQKLRDYADQVEAELATLVSRPGSTGRC